MFASISSTFFHFSLAYLYSIPLVIDNNFRIPCLYPNSRYLKKLESSKADSTIKKLINLRSPFPFEINCEICNKWRKKSISVHFKKPKTLKERREKLFMLCFHFTSYAININFVEDWRHLWGNYCLLFKAFDWWSFK